MRLYEHLKEILFLKETNEHIAIWEGEKLTKERAFEVSGIKSVIWLQDFQNIERNHGVCRYDLYQH